MGTWGVKLYQDDIAEDVRDAYKDRLHRGKNGPTITQELIEEYKLEQLDNDDAAVFWMALADIQWSCGRLEPHVLNKALEYIDSGADMQRWSDPIQAKKRKAVISELRKKITSTQPPEKHFSAYRLYRCNWKAGDVFAYRFASAYAAQEGFSGKYVYFVKVGESVWNPGHIIPVVCVYNTISDELLPLEALNGLAFIPQFYNPSVYERNPDMEKMYLLGLICTSEYSIPKDRLTFIGNVDASAVDSIINKSSYQVYWTSFEEYTLNNHRKWNIFV